MGKNIISQRRGRGTMRYIAPSHRYLTKISHRKYDDIEKAGSVSGKVIDLVHDPGHYAPLALIRYENGERIYIIAPEGMNTNWKISSGNNAQPKLGNTLPLKNIPVGSTIYNIEQNPGDGGKYIRTAGSSAILVAKSENKITIQFPSKKRKDLDPKCRATMGVVASGGKSEKPFVKAGNKHHAMKAKNKLYPIVSGVAMNAVDHPFGSGRGRHIGKPKTPSRFAPPGRKVGNIGARRTGRKR